MLCNNLFQSIDLTNGASVVSVYPQYPDGILMVDESNKIISNKTGFKLVS